MIFEDTGRTYNTRDMRSFVTGNDFLRLVHVGPHPADLFVESWDPTRGAKIDRVARDTVRAIAHVYHMDDLLNLLK
jgi:hypothetical protein